MPPTKKRAALAKRQAAQERPQTSPTKDLKASLCGTALAARFSTTAPRKRVFRRVGCRTTRLLSKVNV